MSTIKVADLQHTSNSNDSISIASNSSVALKHSGNQKLITTANGVDITGACTATSFIGDGANLTNLAAPSSFNAANLTGTLPAIDGSNLTGIGGGGSLEFVSRTYLSSTATYIDLTSFDYESVYKLIIKRAEWGGSAYQNLRVRFFLGYSSPATANIYNYMIEHNGGHYTQNNDDKLDFYQYGGENQYITATFEIYTGYYGYLRGFMHHVGTTNGIRYADIRATLNPSYMTAQRISGVRLYSTNSSSWQVGTEVLLYKYKES